MTNEGRTDDITIIAIFISQRADGAPAAGADDPRCDRELSASEAASSPGRRGSMFTPEAPSAESGAPKPKTRRGSMGSHFPDGNEEA